MKEDLSDGLLLRPWKNSGVKLPRKNDGSKIEGSKVHTDLSYVGLLLSVLLDQRSIFHLDRERRMPLQITKVKVF